MRAAALILCAPLIPAVLAADTASFQLRDKPLQTRPVHDRFVGFSIEVGSTPDVFLVGGLGGPPRKSYSTLLNTLRVAGGSARGPHIRIGGNSADESAWVPTPGTLPRNTTYRITPADLDSYASAVPAWAGSVTIDTTFLYPDPSFMLAHIAAAGPRLGSLIESVELGNELDLFSEHGARPANWGYPDYKKQFATFSDALTSSKVFPSGVPIIQGATWCSDRWVAAFGDYVSSFAPLLATISFHTYAESTCGKDIPTLKGLLADKSSVEKAAFMAPLAAIAIAAKVPFYIGEGNSVSCGGRAGVSDVFASALWVVDVLFNMAAVGVDRWNFHGGPMGAYATIAYSDVTNDVPEVRPMFYGLLAFATATANTSTILTVDTLSNSNELVKCWAVRDASGGVRVVLIHKDPDATGPAHITITPASPLHGTGAVTRLLPGPRGVLAKYNDTITWGGVSWAASTDGTPSGTPTNEPAPANAAGAFVLDLPVGSIAMLTLPAA